MTPVNDDIAAIEKALAHRQWPAGMPARLRRVLDVMERMASALGASEASLTEMERDKRAFPCDVEALGRARAALAAYRGTK